MAGAGPGALRAALLTGGEFLEGEDAVFLSDLGEDISERKNLRREHPETVERLTRLHDEWVKEVESQ